MSDQNETVMIPDTTAPIPAPAVVAEQNTIQTAAPNATAPSAPQVVQVNVNDLKAVAVAALTTIGHPAHHSLLIATAMGMGLGGPNITQINPHIWADWRRGSDGSGKFRFYGKSVFGLTAWGDKYREDNTDPSQFSPSKAKALNSGSLSVEQLALKVERCKKELAAAEAAYAQAKNSASQAGIAPPPTNATPGTPGTPTLDPNYKTPTNPIEGNVKVTVTGGNKLPSAGALQTAPPPPPSKLKSETAAERNARLDKEALEAADRAQAKRNGK